MRSRELLALLLFGAACAGETTHPARLQAFDVLAAPGAVVKLRAKLERKGLLGTWPDVHGALVRFDLGGRLLGRARTGGDGIATLSWKPPRPGIFEVHVRLPRKSRYSAPAAPLLVCVRDPDRPVLVLDVDHTLCDAGGLSVLTRDPRKLPPLKGAVEAVRGLERRFTLLYLTARDDALIHRTRVWLAHHGFPKAPLLVRDLSLGSLSAGRFKRERLAALRRRGWNLSVGVGDRKEDAEAYLAVGMRAFLIGRVRRPPSGAVVCADWKEVLRRIKES